MGRGGLAQGSAAQIGVQHDAGGVDDAPQMIDAPVGKAAQDHPLDLVGRGDAVDAVGHGLGAQFVQAGLDGGLYKGVGNLLLRGLDGLAGEDAVCFGDLPKQLVAHI